MRKYKIILSLLLLPSWGATGFTSLMQNARSIDTQVRLRSDDIVVRSMSTSPSQERTKSSRRDFLLESASLCLVLTLTRPKEVMARQFILSEDARINADEDEFAFEVITTLPKGFSTKALGPKSTLVITVKPAVTYSSQVPKQVADASLSATGHWCPIVLESRQRCSDLLPLAGGGSEQAITTMLTTRHVTSAAGTDTDWWDKLPLVVTAKLDSDGKDSTVGEKDLVGCRIIPNLAGITTQHVTMPLQHRGLCSDILAASKEKV